MDEPFIIFQLSLAYDPVLKEGCAGEEFDSHYSIIETFSVLPGLQVNCFISYVPCFGILLGILETDAD